MPQYTTPGEITLEPSDHLVQPLLAHAQRSPAKAVFSHRVGDRFVDVSAEEVWATVRALAKGLIGLGVRPGDRVAIMSHTRIEWSYLDYAILAVGGATVPIYETSSAEQIAWIVSDSETRLLFVEDQALRDLYDEVADRLPSCRRSLVIEDGALETVTAAGGDVTDETLDERLAGLTTDDVAMIIYTSGTTGRPKGCLLSHGNLRWDAVNTAATIGDMVTVADSQLLFLPLAHVFAKILLLACVEQGAKVGYATSVDLLTEEMPMFRPTYLAAVPRIFEKVHDKARQKAHADGKGAIFDKAAQVATQWSREEQAGGASLRTTLLHAVFDRLVYRKLRDVFGGRLRAATSGGGPLGERLAHVFHGVGIEIYEGYGLTETSPVLTVNHPDAWRIGTVGRPIPGTTIAIADDGEILAKGGQVFQGYYRDEEATRACIDAEGWFHTGDLGALDDDGFLRITGRKKEIIVTAAGKNVAPAPLEDRIKAHPLVSQAMVVGDDRRFIACLVTIDEEAYPAWAEQHALAGTSVADAAESEALRREIQHAVDEANRAVSRAESVREFRILPRDLTVESGEITPTLKVKRRVVSDRWSDVIDDIYAG